MARKLKWTREIRLRIYSQILETFGPRTEWGGKDFSPPGESAHIEQLYKELAKEFSVKFGDIYTFEQVRQQALFGLTQQKKVFLRQSRQFILNKAAAIEVGLISASTLDLWFKVPSGCLEGSQIR